MHQNIQAKQILIKDLKRYFSEGVKPKILPFLYLASYLTIFPMFLSQIIPSKEGNYIISDKYVFSIAQILGNCLTVVFYSILMYFVYTRKYQFCQQYRVNKNVPWPWQKNQVQWKLLFKKTIKSIAFNCLFISPLGLLIGSLIVKRKVFIHYEDLPSQFTLIWQFLLFFIVQDIAITFTHSLLHHPKLYYLHKQHHEYTTSISIAAQYATPFQFVVSNSFPTLVGFIVLSNFYPVHLVSAITWLVFRVLITSDAHCGYDWPWNPLKLFPFSAPVKYHDFHHSHNSGNYASSLIFWDTIFGTNKNYYKYIETNQKKQKQKQT